MIALLILLGIAILAFIGRSFARRGDRSDRVVGATIAWALGVVVALVVVAGLSAPFSPWDMVRLAPSMALLRGAFLFLVRQSLIVMSRHMEYDLKNEIYAHYQKLDTAFYKKRIQ